MRLEPVYLVAPLPKPPAVPTRRAMLIAGGTFLAGLGLGGACGYAVGAGRSGTPGGGGERVEPSGDALLDELRRLAVEAPIEELMQKRLDFINLLYGTYPSDEVAWKGVERLANAVISNASINDRRVFARWLAQGIEKADEPLRTPLEHLIEKLRAIR